MKDPKDENQDNSMRNVVLMSHLGDVPFEAVFDESIEEDADNSTDR